MRWWPFAAGAAIYAAALIATAPAALLDRSLKEASQGRFRLSDTRGTVWSGSGQIEIRDPDGRVGAAKTVAWRVAPASVLRGALECMIDLAPGKPFPVTLSPFRIEIRDAGISLPAAALGLGIPRLAPLGLTGELLITAPQLSITRDRVDGSATLKWLAAGSTLTQVSPLGDYEVRLDGEQKAVRAVLLTLQGPIQLDGQGAWSLGQNPRFLGTVKVPAQHQQALSPLLRLIAVERGEGTFDLQLK